MGVDQRSVLEVKLERLVACIARDRLLQYVAAQEDRLLLLRVPLLRVRLFALTVESNRLSVWGLSRWSRDNH